MFKRGLLAAAMATALGGCVSPVVQPDPFSRGETGVEPSTAIQVEQEDSKVALLDGPDLETLVAGLNRIGVKPDGIIAILQGIKSAGALQADLVLQ